MPDINNSNGSEPKVVAEQSSWIDRETDISQQQGAMARSVAALSANLVCASRPQAYQAVHALSLCIRHGSMGARAHASRALADLVRRQSDNSDGALESLVSLSLDTNFAVRLHPMVEVSALPDDDVLIQRDLSQFFGRVGDTAALPNSKNWLFVIAQTLESDNFAVRAAAVKYLNHLIYSVDSSKHQTLFNLAVHASKSRYQDVREAAIEVLSAVVRLTHQVGLVNQTLSFVSNLIETKVPGEEIAAAKLLKELVNVPSHQEIALSLLEDLVFIASEEHCPAVLEQLGELTWGPSCRANESACSLFLSMANHLEDIVRHSALSAIEKMASSSSQKIRETGMSHLKKTLLSNPHPQTIEDACSVLSRLVQSEDTQVQESALQMLVNALDRLS